MSRRFITATAAHPPQRPPAGAALSLQRRRLFALPAGLLMAGVALPGWARMPIDARWLRVEVQDRDSGETLPVHTAADGQRYVAGRPGARYGVTLRNLRRERVLIVMSVDGVNVLTGETAGWDQNGYVLGPLASGQIAGWRKSDREIAAFEFTAPGDAYASRTGRPLDLGVIGVAVFAERRPGPPRAMPEPLPPAVLRQQSAPTQERADSNSGNTYDGSARKAAPAEAESAAPPASAAAAASPRGALGAGADSEAPAPASPSPMRRERAARAEDKLGTGHGQREESVVTHTRFERARGTPDEVIALRYDSRANLIRMGVIANPDDDRVARPRPFPQRDPQAGYVPDPPRF